MSAPWPDYRREGLEVFEQPTFEVYDPWLAQVRGVFYTREDADLFQRALMAQLDGVL